MIHSRIQKFTPLTTKITSSRRSLSLGSKKNLSMQASNTPLQASKVKIKTRLRVLIHTHFRSSCKNRRTKCHTHVSETSLSIGSKLIRRFRASFLSSDPDKAHQTQIKSSQEIRPTRFSPKSTRSKAKKKSRSPKRSITSTTSTQSLFQTKIF